MFNLQMNLLTSPNRWSCLPTALAMLLGKSLKNILDKIGHDGSLIKWPEYDEPYCRRSFCINEIVYAAFEYSVALTEVAPVCNYHPYGHEEGSLTISVPSPSWEDDLLSRHDALLLGEGHSGVSHAVAWNSRRKLIYDPTGTRYNLDLFRRELIYLAIPIGPADWGTIRKEEL